MKTYGNLTVPWEIRGYSNAGYAGVNDTQKSVTGYIVLINGVVIAWRFQIQNTVLLSLTDSKYSVITEVCCEILFFRAVLFFMWVIIKYPITGYIGNVELFNYRRTLRYPNRHSKYIFITISCVTTFRIIILKI